MWVFFESRRERRNCFLSNDIFEENQQVRNHLFERDVSVIFWGTNLDKGVVLRYPAVDESNHPTKGGLLKD